MTKKLTVLSLIATLAAVGCAGLLEDAKSPNAAKLFECRVGALAPAVAGVFDARDLVRDVYAGRADLASVLAQIGLTTQELRELRDRLRACVVAPSAHTPVRL